MGRALQWDRFSGNRAAGDLSQASLVSDWMPVGGNQFSIQLVWTGAGAPVGALSFEVSNNQLTPDPVDPSQVASAPWTNPGDGAGGADHTTILFLGFFVGWVRVKYARSGGGAADTIAGFVWPETTR